MGLIINGEVIADQVLEEEFEALKEHQERLGESVCCDRDREFRGYARENVLNRTLLRQEAARRFGECSEEEIDKALADIKEQHGGEQEFYKNVGLTEEKEGQVREKVADSLLVNKVLKDAMGEGPEPGEEELEKYYRDNVEDYLSAEEIRVWHLFLEPRGPEEAREGYETLRKVRRELRGGGDFEVRAKELCREDHQMDMGFFGRGSMLAELEAVVFSMEEGEVSPVMATPFGYHLFKLVARRGLEPISLAEVRERVLEQFQAEYREGKINGLLDQLREGAQIEGEEGEMEI